MSKDNRAKFRDNEYCLPLTAKQRLEVFGSSSLYGPPDQRKIKSEIGLYRSNVFRGCNNEFELAAFRRFHRSGKAEKQNALDSAHANLSRYVSQRESDLEASSEEEDDEISEGEEERCLEFQRGLEAFEPTVDQIYGLKPWPSRPNRSDSPKPNKQKSTLPTIKKIVSTRRERTFDESMCRGDSFRPNRSVPLVKQGKSKKTNHVEPKLKKHKSTLPTVKKIVTTRKERSFDESMCREDSCNENPIQILRPVLSRRVKRHVNYREK